MSCRVVFMGTPDFAVPVLQALVAGGYPVVGVVTQPDRPAGRKKILTASPVKRVALTYDLPLLQPARLRDPEAIAAVQALEPELIVTAAYGQMVPDEILAFPKHRCLNVHASCLPRYRGGAPIHWALMEGEVETGVTILTMVTKLDAGDMLAQRCTPIAPDDDVASLYDRLSQMGADLLLSLLPAWIAGRLEPVPQDPAQVTFAPTIKRADEELDCRQPSSVLAQRVRGLAPWPGAFLRRPDGSCCKVWEAIARPTSTPGLLPGQVAGIDEEVLWLATGEGELGLLRIQPAGKCAIAVKDWLRGHPLEFATPFGGVM